LSAVIKHKINYTIIRKINEQYAQISEYTSDCNAEWSLNLNKTSIDETF